jgi:hypothetical protein
VEPFGSAQSALMIRPGLMAMRSISRRSRWFGLAAATGFVVLSGGSYPGQEPLRPERRWDERWASSVPVSGTVVPGIMVGEQSVRVLDESITLRVPRETPASICVTITSQDGRYHARAQFQAAATSSGIVTLEGPRRYRRNLRRYPAGELAISAELTTSCDGRPATRVPAGWGRRFADGDVFVYVNSRYHTEALWRAGDGGSKTVVCPEIGNRQYVAFNRVCRIPRAELPEAVSLLVRSRRDGNSFSNTTLSLGYPR